MRSSETHSLPLSSLLQLQAKPSTGSAHIRRYRLHPIILLALILIATDAFRAVAQIMSAPLPAITLGLIAILILFLLSSFGQTMMILRSGPFTLFLGVACVWPLITLTYSSAEPTSFVIERFSIACVLLGSALYFIRTGLPGARRLFMLSAIITLVGTMISWLLPDVFQGMAAEARANLAYEGRAFGFYLQPNALGIAMCFIMLSWIVAEYPRSQLRFIVWLIIFSVTVVLSGSRFSLLVMCLITFMVYVLDSGTSRAIVARRLTRLAQAAGLFAAAWAIAYGLFNLFELASLAHGGNFYDRLNSLLNFQIFHSADTETGGSLAERQLAQEEYWRLLDAQPWFGHGYGTQATLLSEMVLRIPAHNSALALSVDLGVPYVVVLWLTFVFSAFYRRGRLAWERLSLHCGLIFLLSLTPSILFNHGLLENRFFYIPFAFLLALTCFPELVLRGQASPVFRSELSVQPASKNLNAGSCIR